MVEKPWDGVFDATDLAAMGRSYDDQDRQISAGTRPAVIVVDMTRAFVDSTYPTGFSPTGFPAAAANARLLEAARSREIPVFFTKGYADPMHRPTPAERGRWKTTSRPAPPAEAAPGDVIVDELTPRPGEIVLNKGGKPSAFFGTPLVSYLVHAGCDTTIITGMVTSGCVRATVMDSFQNNFHCVIPYECVADRNQLSHKVSLFDLHMKYADVVSLDETLAYLEGLGASRRSELADLTQH